MPNPNELQREREFKLQTHHVSVGVYRVYNVEVKAASPELAENIVKQYVEHEGYDRISDYEFAKDCGVCPEQCLVQYEWSEDV